MSVHFFVFHTRLCQHASVPAHAHTWPIWISGPWAKELHADHVPTGSIEQAVRAEIFKVVWPKLGKITR